MTPGQINILRRVPRREPVDIASRVPRAPVAGTWIPLLARTTSPARSTQRLEDAAAAYRRIAALSQPVAGAPGHRAPISIVGA